VERSGAVNLGYGFQPFFFAKSPAGQSHTAEDIKNYKDMPRVICQKCDCQSLVPWHGGEARFGASRENVKR